MADRDAFAQRNPDTDALKVFDQHMASFLAVHQKVVSFVKMGSSSAAATRHPAVPAVIGECPDATPLGEIVQCACFCSNVTEATKTLHPAHASICCPP